MYVDSSTATLVALPFCGESQCGEKYGLIKKMGSSYSYGETKIGRVYDSARLFLKENKTVAKEILKQMKSDSSFSVSASSEDKDEGSPE